MHLDALQIHAKLVVKQEAEVEATAEAEGAAVEDAAVAVVAVACQSIRMLDVTMTVEEAVDAAVVVDVAAEAMEATEVAMEDIVKVVHVQVVVAKIALIHVAKGHHAPVLHSLDVVHYSCNVQKLAAAVAEER